MRYVSAPDENGLQAPLRILFCPHELVTGGSQINAIDLATRLRDRGHTIEIYAPSGPLESLIQDRGIPFRKAPPRAGDSLNPRILRAFSRAIRGFRPDAVVAFETPPAIAAAALSLTKRLPLVVSTMSMSISDYFPTHAPLIVGTAEFVHSEMMRRDDVHLMEPPVDTDLDAPRDTSAARAQLGVPDDSVVVSVVGRLSAEHQKAIGVAAAIRDLSRRELPDNTVLLVAGDGDDADIVKRAADESVNPRLDVRLLGNVSDPRPVYDAADITFGMGGSALRAMAHRKPLIVQGSDGFWKLFDSETAGFFFAQGMFGRGQTGAHVGDLVLRLSGDTELRERLGGLGRRTILERYSLDTAADLLEHLIMKEATSPGPRSRAVRASGMALARYARFRIAHGAPGLQRTYRRLTGRR